MEYRDYYAIMGLKRDASQEEIKSTYRKLARKYHPDVSKVADAENKFKELGEAYEVLKDPKKRAQYDQYGQHWQQQGQQAPHRGQSNQHYQQGNSGINEDEFADFLSSIFRQRQQQEQASFYDKGQDIHAKLNISLEDSFHGTEKNLQLQTPVLDKNGYMNYEQRVIKVKIPKGIAEQQQIRLKGQGNKIAGGQSGDLYIEIHIEPHPLFKVEKKDIYLQLPITPWEAVLGASVKVPTLAGVVQLKIPKLSQNGKQMRLKGRGLPGNPAGDQLVSLQIVIPTEENPAANKLYEQLAQTCHYNPRQKLGVDA